MIYTHFRGHNSYRTQQREWERERKKTHGEKGRNETKRMNEQTKTS